MISVSLIDRCLLKNDHDRLLRELVRNGLVMPPRLQKQLAQTPTACRALGLRRLTELTYRPTPQSIRIARQLLDSQRIDGHFHADPSQVHASSLHTTPCPLTTAVVLAGLHRIDRDLLDPSDATALLQACALATDAIGHAQQRDGLFAAPGDWCHEHRLMTAAFIAYLLADDAGFRDGIDYGALARAFDTPAARLHRDTAQLWTMAQLTDAPLSLGTWSQQMPTLSMAG